MWVAPGPSTSKIATVYPPSAKRRAIPAPIPAAAPVTMTVFLRFIFEDPVMSEKWIALKTQYFRQSLGYVKSDLHALFLGRLTLLNGPHNSSRNAAGDSCHQQDRVFGPY